MIKRDYIQRVRVIPTDDAQGGSSVELIPYEKVRAHCSITATGEQITQYGITTQKMINAITDVKLDEYILTRYVYEGTIYRLMRQVKRGNEWFSVLMETVEDEEVPDDNL